MSKGSDGSCWPSVSGVHGSRGEGRMGVVSMRLLGRGFVSFRRGRLEGVEVLRCDASEGEGLGGLWFARLGAEGIS